MLQIELANTESTHCLPCRAQFRYSTRFNGNHSSHFHYTVAGLPLRLTGSKQIVFHTKENNRKTGVRSLFHSRQRPNCGIIHFATEHGTAILCKVNPADPAAKTKESIAAGRETP